MEKQNVHLRDSMRNSLKDKLSIGTDNTPRLKGHVEIYERDKEGKETLREKQNLIVYSGREWLLNKAFGPLIEGNDPLVYENQLLKWFGCGIGGGEAGNPLQAGATTGSDTDLYQPLRLRDDLTDSDPGWESYGSRKVDSTVYTGYYKKISNVTKKEDHANPYLVDGETVYPPIIAELRIELSSDDANGDSYEDINEAALFVGAHSEDEFVDPGDPPSGYPTYGGTVSIDPLDITKVIRDESSYNTTYVLDTDDPSDMSDINVGDTLYVTGTSDQNLISSDNPLTIVDVYEGEIGVANAYVVVEKTDSEDETPSSVGDMVANFNNRDIDPYTMFARVTFSTIRKTVDRELVFLWKLYF